MRSTVLIAAVVSIVTVGVVGEPPAVAATAEPALLRAKDLPKSLRQSTPSKSTPSGQTMLVVDPATCEETSTETFDGISDVAVVFRASGSSKADPPLLSESVTTYSSESSARRGFEDRLENNDAAEECGAREPAAVKTVGDDSFASTGGTVAEPDEDVTSITFVSGSHVVEVIGSSSAKGPDDDDLEAIAVKAGKRLARSAAEANALPKSDITVDGKADVTFTEPPRCSKKGGVTTMTIEAPQGYDVTLTITDEDSRTAVLLVGSTPYEYTKGTFDFTGDAVSFESARFVWRGDAVMILDGSANC
jgi:hypothetical protein